MLLPITTTSQVLKDMLTASQEAQVKIANNRTSMFTVAIQNDSEDTVYVELGAVATTSGSYKIETDEENTFVVYDLKHVNLIADANVNVRVIII